MTTRRNHTQPSTTCSAEHVAEGLHHSAAFGHRHGLNRARTKMAHRAMKCGLAAIAASAVLTVAPGILTANPMRAPRASAAPDGFVGVPPARLLDTREGIGAPRGPVGPNGVINLQITGRGGVPAADVVAVILNVTVTEPTGTGYITAWPTGEGRPTASNLNFVAGQTVPNLVLVKVGAGGRVSLFNSSGASHVLADVSGYYVTGSQLVPITPNRALDTRLGVGGVTGPTSGVIDVQLTGRAGVPADATSVVMNVTVTEPSSAGYLTVWPKGVSRPDASNLNFLAGQTVPNLVVAKIGAEGKVSYVNNSGRVHVIIDVLGYVAEAGSLTELLDRVDYNYAAAEKTVQLQGQPRFNSLHFDAHYSFLCSASTPSWTEYNLGRQWGTLSTTIGFDDNESTATSRMRFRIIGDGTVLADRTINFGQSNDLTVTTTGILRIRFEVLNANTGGNPCSSNPVFATPTLAR